MTRTGLSLLLVAGAGCRDCSDPPRRAVASPLEASIQRELGRQLHGTIWVSCDLEPPHCWGIMPDTTLLPIALSTSGNAWDWRIDGLLVRALEVESQVHAALVDLERDQTVACGARIRRAVPNEIVTCKLGGGGQAFARIAADGRVTLELELDAAAAAARAEARREAELTATSSALSDKGGDEDDDPAPDAGVAAPVDASAAQL